MLRKLLKYDLRANMKIYCFLWPSLVIAAVLQRLLNLIHTSEEVQSFLLPLTSTLLMFSILGSTVGSMVICVTRFYKGLLKEEGYLMFTLPVHPWQLILSKLLASLLTLIITGILSIVSVIFLWGGFEDVKDILTALASIGQIITGSATVNLIYITTLMILSQSLSILQIYLACAIGHLVKKHRVVTSIAVWFGLNYGQQYITLLCVVSSIITEQFAPWLFFLSIASLVALFFYLTQRILKKHLNLE